MASHSTVGARPGAVLVAAFTAAVALLAPTVARAQFERAAPPPTGDILLPGQSLTLDPDAASLVVNPALPAFLRSWSVVVAHTELTPRGRFAGTGDGIFWSFPVPLLPLHVTLGGQVLRPSRAFGADYVTTGKLSLGIAGRVARGLGVGLATHVFLSPQGALHGKVSLDAGVSLEATSWLALAVAVRDINNPDWGGLRLQRRWAVEVGLRPWENDRFTLSLGFQVGERRGDVEPRVRLGFSPYSGLSFFADATWLRRDLDGADGREERVDDLRITAGLRLDFAHFGVGAGFVGGLHSRPGGAAAGGAAWVRLSGSRYRSVARANQRLVLFDVGAADSIAAQWRLIRKLEWARRAPGVRGVLLKISGAGGWAAAEELRAAIRRLQQAGRQVFAYLFNIGTLGYYVASACDRIVLFPGGNVRLSGLRTRRFYVKGTLDKLGIRAQFIRYAEYKSAPEMFTRVGPSPEAERVMRAVMGDFAGRFYRALAKRPKIGSPAKARALLERGPFTAKEAEQLGLVDALRFPDKIDPDLKKLYGRLYPAARAPRAPKRRERWGSRPLVAIVRVEGDITSGRSQRIPVLNRRTTGAKTLARLLKQLSASDRVKAVVLRVDSGGGSALASDFLWRHLTLLAKRKPLVASLGNIAASGGYYVAAPAKRIFALPSTVTGSIGIFSGKADFSGLLAKVGVNVHVTKRGVRADIESPFRAYTPEELKALHKKLGYYYRRFLDAVAKGRKGLGTAAKVDEVARGRVWTGQQAQRRRLVDQIGGLWDAVAYARELAGLRPGDGHRVLLLPRRKPSFLRRLLRLVVPGARRAAPSVLLRQLLRPLGALPPSVLLSSPGTPLARLPFDFQVR